LTALADAKNAKDAKSIARPQGLAPGSFAIFAPFANFVSKKAWVPAFAGMSGYRLKP
jgi:hypothetical protein